MGAPDLFGMTAREQAVDALHAATAIYTAEPVVDGLLDRLQWPREGGRLVDPSCGDGIFLGRALERLLALRPNIAAEQIVDAIEGWEIHPHAAAQSRTRVVELLCRHGWTSGQAAGCAARIVRNSDFLTEGPSVPTYDAVAGNPPYMRRTYVPSLLRAEYEAVVPSYASSDLLHGFLDRCAAALRPGGEIAMVTADRWLFNMGAGTLRAVLGQALSIHHLERLDVNTAFYRPKQRKAGTPPRIHPVGVVMRKEAASGASILLTEDPIYPGAAAPALGGPATTLGDIARVGLAPWLGSPGIFVVDAGLAAQLPADCLVPAVDTDDFVAGEMQLPRRFAIRTHPNMEPPPEVMAHLHANLHRMAARGRRKQPWIPPESWHRMTLDQPLLVVPRIARSLRPIRVPAGVLPINHNLSVVSAGTATLDEVEAHLMSDAANKWVRAHAAPLEGGFFSLTTTLLRNLPIGA